MSWSDDNNWLNYASKYVKPKRMKILTDLDDLYNSKYYKEFYNRTGKDICELTDFCRQSAKYSWNLIFSEQKWQFNSQKQRYRYLVDRLQKDRSILCTPIPTYASLTPKVDAFAYQSFIGRKVVQFQESPMLCEYSSVVDPHFKQELTTAILQHG